MICVHYVNIMRIYLKRNPFHLSPGSLPEILKILFFQDNRFLLQNLCGKPPSTCFYKLKWTSVTEGK